MEQLKLENQICFPFYAISRLITRAYQPFLDDLGITYPQYLVLMVLWEEDMVTVNGIANKLILNTNTITPLLKRMEKQGLIIRNRSNEDERKVLIKLTQKGSEMKLLAASIPESLLSSLKIENYDEQQFEDFRVTLKLLISFLKQSDENREKTVED
ncbi:MAG: transcriptional regulator [Bacteroidetes bacterium]|nr:MAG: transcriptional regulator [Bacteroidota bacterium]